MNELRNIHPGEVLMEEFLIPLELSAYRLSKDIGIPQTRISEILKGKRRITADSALRLAQYFGNSAKFWLGLQDDYDIEEGMRMRKSEISSMFVTLYHKYLVLHVYRSLTGVRDDKVLPPQSSAISLSTSDPSSLSFSGASTQVTLSLFLKKVNWRFA